MGLENSISEMIERQEGLSDLADAAKDRFDTYLAQAAPGLQPLLGLLPNQCGVDSNGDGLPDGWYLPANDGFTSWQRAGQTTVGFGPTEIPAGGLEEEFYAAIPNSNRDVLYRNHVIHFWRFSWDLTAGGAPATISAIESTSIPFTGMMGAWIKEEVPGVLDHVVWAEGGYVFRGTNDWAIWASRQPPRKNFSYPGNYSHARLDFDTAQIPNTGSILVAAPQALSTVIPLDLCGWGVFPGLNRVNDNGDFSHTLNFASNQWEFK